ncbi:TonB-dependent receptor family protein [Massilia sp. DWR3-1-1]|uniref:TonB-dependent receptor family protein n=1 Tax=Massilia sp. DWR3-1-1 TaxID=2804559 RepID=UPI003CF2346A
MQRLLTMMFISHSRRPRAVQPLVLAALLSACFASAAHASGSSGSADAPAASDLPTVLVTGSRFANPLALAPIGATVISAEDIRRAGATDVNQAIRKVGGVFGRQSLDASPDFSLDLRGFGTNSAQNMVVLVDGVRLSENELANPVLSAIPIDTVERIEIVRGGSSVLYGDGATGGVIQIITRRGSAARATRASLSAEIGTLGAHDARASVATSYRGVALDAAIDNQASDNDRANSRYQASTFSGGAQFALGDGHIGVRVDSARQKSRFPGSLTQAQFDANPGQSLTPDDFGAQDSDRVSAVLEQRFGAVDLVAELSHREKTVKAHYVADFGFGPSVSDARYATAQTQFSPRLRQRARFGAIDNELVGGVDLLRWKRRTSADFSNADARQSSRAVYVRDELRFDGAHAARLAAGVRHEVFDKDTTDTLSYPAASDHAGQSLNAWDLQGSYAIVPALTLHAKAGHSYRLANADENSYRSSSAILAPQTSHDLEAGASWADDGNALAVRLFRHRLVNEIYYDPTVLVNGFPGANTNLDATERRGIELDGQLRLAAAWRLSGHAQHLTARFTDGVNRGRALTLVPANMVSARLSWTPGSGRSADLGAQWVDRQRFGSDFSNSCTAQIAAHTTLDARLAQRVGPWEFALAGSNLADKRFTSQAFSCRAGIYPENGRQLKLSARYDF